MLNKSISLNLIVFQGLARSEKSTLTSELSMSRYFIDFTIWFTILTLTIGKAIKHKSENKDLNSF